MWEPRTLKLKITRFSNLVFYLAGSIRCFSTGPTWRGVTVILAYLLSCICSINWSYRLLSYQQTSPPWNRPRTWRRTVVPQFVRIRRLTDHRYPTTWRHRGPTMPTLSQVWGWMDVPCAWKIIQALRSVLLRFRVCLAGYRNTEYVSAVVTLRTGTQGVTG
jgi:hypothetical protein